MANIGKNIVSLASSYDGKNIAAACNAVNSSDGDYIYTSTNGGSSWTQRTSAGSKRWLAIVSSSNGMSLAATVYGGGNYIYTSTDGGANWIERQGCGAKWWRGIAMSADGLKIAASPINSNGTATYLYTSTDGGATWTERQGAGQRSWTGIASSADGLKLVAVAEAGGKIWTSTNGGASWTQRDYNQGWGGVSSSADGVTLVAWLGSGSQGYLWKSTDSGVTWSQMTSSGSRYWYSATISKDGQKIIAAGQLSVATRVIQVSLDGGSTWSSQWTGYLAYGTAASYQGLKLMAGCYSGEFLSVGDPMVVVNVGSTSLTVNWETPTGDAATQYKLVKASSAAAIDTVGEADAITGNDLLLDWTANTLTKAVTGLTEGGDYWFAALSNDNGSKAIYTPINQVTTSAPPVVGSGLSFSNVTASSLTVSWGAATDSGTAQSALQYKLVKALNSASIDSVAEADAVTGDDLLLDWTANTLTKNVTGLNDGIDYWFAVLVKDEVGNKSLYPNNHQATLDITPPAVVNKTLTLTDPSNRKQKSTALFVDCEEAIDNSGNVLYSFFISTSNNLDTIENTELNGTISGQGLWSSTRMSVDFSGLTPSTSYYINAIAKDPSENKTLYNSTMFTTPAPDVTAPICGSLTVSWLGSTSIMFNSPDISDDQSDSWEVNVVVYRSSLPNITTISDMQANGTMAGLMDWGLIEGTKYYYNYIGIDLDGNSAASQMIEVTTLDQQVPALPREMLAAFGQAADGSRLMGNGYLGRIVTLTADEAVRIHVKLRSSQPLNNAPEIYIFDMSAGIPNTDLYPIFSQTIWDSIGVAWTDIYVDTFPLSAGTYRVCVLSASNDDLEIQMATAASVAGSATISDGISPFDDTVTTGANITMEILGGTVIPSLFTVSDTSVNISWPPATDNVTPTSKVEYAVYGSDSLDWVYGDDQPDVASIEAAVGSGVDLVTDYMTGTVRNVVGTFNTASGIYKFCVIAKDQALNKSAFPTTSVRYLTSGIISPDVDGKITSLTGNVVITPSSNVLFDVEKLTKIVLGTDGRITAGAGATLKLAYGLQTSIKTGTIYRLRSPLPAALTLDPNTGSGSTVVADGFFMRSIAIPLNSYTKDFYTFSGWNTAEDGSGTSYADGAKYKFLTTTATLYAQWAPI